MKVFCNSYFSESSAAEMTSPSVLNFLSPNYHLDETFHLMKEADKDNIFVTFGYLGGIVIWWKIFVVNIYVAFSVIMV